MVSANKRIAYNTIILYIKLILSVVIGLYSSRLILHALGNSDFGLYSVVGGIVALLNVVGVSMVSTSYRFIGIEIGKGKDGNPNKVYNTVLVIHILLAVLFVIMGLSIGLWYVDSYLNVENGKLPDARYVLVVSILTTAISVISIPYNGLIIAREKFTFTSAIEIIQLLLKLLLIVYVLEPFTGNKLLLYTNLMAFVTLIAPISYSLYCKVNEKDISRWKFNSCLRDYKAVCSFTGWMILSTFSFMGVSQGGAMILNSFFGTVINAGFGIAIQVQNYLLMFPKNIIQAASPQIMKSYGADNEDHAIFLVYNSTKFCFYIFLLMAVPCLLFMNEILQLWLGDAPPLTSVFTSFLIISSVIGSLTNGFDPLVLASGNIKLMQIGYVITNFIQLPVIYFAYSLGFPAYTNVVIMVLMTIISIVYQIYVINRVSNFVIKNYINQTVIPALKVLLIVIPMFLLRVLIHDISFIQLFLYVIVVVVCLSVWIFYAGLKQQERFFVIQLILRNRGGNNK